MLSCPPRTMNSLSLDKENWTLTLFYQIIFSLRECLASRVYTGINRVTVNMLKWTRIFFHFHYEKGFRISKFWINSKIIFSHKPEISGTLFQNFRTFWIIVPKISGISFWKVHGKIVPNFFRTMFQNFSYQGFGTILETI